MADGQAKSNRPPGEAAVSAPRAAGMALPEGAAQAAPPLSIVCLDDDADFRQYMVSVLEGHGHEVRAAATPEECYAFCEESLPDILLLDMKMGRHNGETVLQEVRRRWPRLCVIVVTGYPTLDSMRQTFKQDVFDYLAKPFSVAELSAAIGQAAAAFGLGQRPQDKLRHELGRQIRMARTEREWTLKELSERCGMSVSQLSSIERGSHLPSLESLLAIAGSLERSPSQWMSAAGF
ncbi:MAG: response regulator [Phycisphaerales bacterium]|nr:response regulator [Phycisphaerales bacterium]